MDGAAGEVGAGIVGADFLVRNHPELKPPEVAGEVVPSAAGDGRRGKGAVGRYRPPPSKQLNFDEDHARRRAGRPWRMV